MIYLVETIFIFMYFFLFSLMDFMMKFEKQVFIINAANLMRGTFHVEIHQLSV